MNAHSLKLAAFASGLIFLLSAATAANAQDPLSDSLRSLLPRLEGKERLDAMKQLAYLSQFQNLTYNRACIQDFLDESREQEDMQYEGDARIMLMAYYYNNLILDSLSLALPTQLDFFSQNDQWENYYYVWKQVIETYAYDQKFSLALQEAEKMGKEAQERKDEYGTAYSYFCLGLVYENMDNYDEAIRQYEECIHNKKRDSRLTNSVYYYICETLNLMGNYEKLLDYTREYWDVLRENYPELSKSELESTPQATPCLIFQANAFIGKGQLDKARELIEKAEATARNRPVHHYLLLNACIDYDLAIGNLDNALKYSDELLALVDDINLRREIGNAEAKRAEVLMAAGRYEEAAKLWKSVYTSTKEANTASIQHQLSELTTYFQVNSMKMEGELEQQRSRFVNSSLLTILVVIGLLAFLTVNNRWSRRLEVKNRQLQRERNVVVGQNRQLEIERDRAKAASKAKTAFIESMTHEIRTPLNAINGFSQMLTTPGLELPEEEQRDYSNRIMVNTRLLTDIVDDLILVSDMESSDKLPGETEARPVKEIVSDAEKVVIPQVAPGVQLVTKIDLPENTVIETYPKHLGIALNKLLDNAAKFTKSGSIDVIVCRDGRGLCFCVADTGPGIPEDKKEYVFERFTKLYKFSQGTGLGLPVARMIAERMGGSLELDTSYKNGAKFDLTIPYNPVS